MMDAPYTDHMRAGRQMLGHGTIRRTQKEYYGISLLRRQVASGFHTYGNARVGDSASY